MPYLDTGSRRYPLKSGMNFLGRDPLCSVFVPDPHISRKHASLDLVSDGSMTLMDLGSTNGIVVNGKKVPSAILNPGDSFSIGETHFIVMKNEAATDEWTPNEIEGTFSREKIPTEPNL